jgi:hypothetical protein
MFTARRIACVARARYAQRALPISHAAERVDRPA